METRVKISQFAQKLKTSLNNFGRKSFTANILGSESVANHNIALLGFNNQIRSNFGQDIVQHRTRGLPVIDRTCELLFARPPIARIFGTTKCVFKPNNNGFIATGDLKHRMPLISIAIFSLFCVANIDAAFSIYKTCKISNLGNCMFGFKSNDFPHVYPFVNYFTVVNENVHGERLSEKDPQGYAIV